MSTLGSTPGAASAKRAWKREPHLLEKATKTGARPEVIGRRLEALASCGIIDSAENIKRCNNEERTWRPRPVETGIIVVLGSIQSTRPDKLSSSGKRASGQHFQILQNSTNRTPLTSLWVWSIVAFCLFASAF